MNGRDEEYIWNRLSSPCTDALDAHERMKKVGLHEEAEQLMTAVKEFTDQCRAVRQTLAENR